MRIWRDILNEKNVLELKAAIVYFQRDLGR